MALTSLSGEDVEEVAAALYDELDALEVEEVWDRAGRTRHGYVETSEVASQMIEAVLAPYLEELSRYQALGLNLEAGEMCQGLLLGLYQFEHEFEKPIQGLGDRSAARLCPGGVGCMEKGGDR